MGNQGQIYLFGDQTFDFYAKLKELLHSNISPLLESFLEQAYYKIRSEIASVSSQERESFSQFTSLRDLLSWQRSPILHHPAIQSALTCIYQLGEFIRQHERVDRRPFPVASETCISGLCTGALSAAAVSCCRNLQELLPVAVQTVAVAFHTGLCALDTRTRITTSSEPWSLVISSNSPESVAQSLRKFSESNHLPVTSQPYISTQLLNRLTVSGPPGILSQLRDSSRFVYPRVATIPVYAPYHAPHLFVQADIDQILEKTSAPFWQSYERYIPVISGATGNPVDAKDFRSCLEAGLRQILIEPIRFQELSRGVARLLQSRGSHAFSITPVGTTADFVLSSALKDVLGTIEDLQQGVETSMDEANGQQDRVYPPIPSSVQPGKSKIAIIGMSGRYPCAEDNQEFWNILFTGLDVHKEVPALHWNAKTHFDPTRTRKNTSATPFGCWLDHPEAFDAQFFNISPREAPQIDPAQRIALMTAYEAIEQAGIVPDATPSTSKDRVGVFYGVTSNDWMETNSAQNIDTYFIPGGNRAFIPGRVNYFFKFSGPSYSVDTACSSSLAAIHVACNSLWRGDVDTAIAGGTNVLTNPDFTAGLDRGHFLSRTGNCKTFDDGADGYCRGEGVGTVVLKRLEAALADNDPILAVILGAHTNHSAEAESITRPHIGAQRVIFSKILNDAGVDPYTVSYVEMHGTGTQAGDAGEMSSVLDIFAPSSFTRQHRRDDQALYLGSAKANIGHGEAASGVSSLVKVLLMMQKNIIPPHCGIKSKINHRFPTDLVERNVHIAKNPVPWPAINDQPRRVFVNNFSAAGGNSALLLEDRPAELPQEGVDPRTSHVVAMTAKNAISLSRNLTSLLSYIEERGMDVNLGQLSYTTTARRIHHLHRVMVSGSTIEEIKDCLRAAIDRGDGSTRPKSAPKVMFSFTGQGRQYPGMGKQLYKGFSRFRNEILRLDKLGQAFGFPTFTPYFEDCSSADSNTYSPLASQLAMVSMQIALKKMWASWGVQPYAVIGHSLGEYSALNAAGVLTDADTIFLVGMRGQLLEKRCSQYTHSMLVVKSSLSAIETALAGMGFEISCINGPEETVIGGPKQRIDSLQGLLKQKGFVTTLINLPFAYHTSQVDVILDELEMIAQGVTFAEPAIPIISTQLGEPITQEGILGPQYLRRHCRESVKFLDAVRSAKQCNLVPCKSFVVELGPHPVLTNLVKSALGSDVTALPTLHQKQHDWKVVADTITQLYCAGSDLCWQEYHRDFKASHKVLPLPAYSWNLKDHWMPYANDWSLRKGDPPLIISAPARLESTTIHTVLEDTVTKIVVESDICRPDLDPLVQGHVVDNIPLCTPSVYADIALTLAKHLIDRYKPELQDCQVEIADMTIQKALVAKPEGPQLMRTFVDVDWSEKRAQCRFATLDRKGEATVVHAQCAILYTDRSWLEQLQRTMSETKLRMMNLRKGIESGATQRFSRAMVYKMIRPLAQFHEDYRALDEVIINSDTLEACSRVNFKTVKVDGKYHTHPAYIDGLTQSGGFVMNCHDLNDLDIEVFVNHGWESFQLYQPLDAEKTYTTFVQMFEGDSRMFRGNLVVFEGDELVACYKNICLQGVPRRVLRHILSLEAKHKPQDGGIANRPSPASIAATKPASKATAVSIVPKTEVIVAQTSTTAGSAKFRSAMKILSEESGVAEAELSDDTIFADIGIDSLLSLVIMTRFREELDMELDSEDFFTRYATVRAFKELQEPAASSVLGSTSQAAPPPTQVVHTIAEADIVRDALRIISEESGVAEHELTNDTIFSDVGIDSLLSLVITSRFREELDVDFELDDFFTRYATVKDLKQFFVPVASSMATSTSLLAEMAVPLHQPAAQSMILHALEGGVPPGFQDALAIISEESGVSVADLTEDCIFSDIGIDSLLSLVIVSRFREELGLDITMDSVFTEFPNVRQLKRLFAPESGETSATISIQLDSSDEECQGCSSTSTQSTVSEQSNCPTPAPRPVPAASSVLLQGHPKKAGLTVFLFPDGAGSATSYSGIPKIATGIAVVALNSPYYKNPAEFKCDIDDLIDSYLAEVRRRQPSGPYHFGGWSAGGILAYRATQKLIAADEVVEHLILIDSPVPKGLDKLPQHFYDFCNEHRLFGHTTNAGSSASPPEWLIPHFNATIDTLHDYFASPLPAGKTPRTSLIWASESVVDGMNVHKLPPHPDDTEGMKFLTERRTDFSGNGWDTLLPGGQLKIEKAEGANHFTMLRGEFAPKMAKFILESLA